MGIENNISLFRGDENNATDIIKQQLNLADIVVRVTADDPLKDYKLIDIAIEKYRSKNRFCLQ